jgi:hypothetical protein
MAVAVAVVTGATLRAWLLPVLLAARVLMLVLQRAARRGRVALVLAVAALIMQARLAALAGRQVIMVAVAVAAVAVMRTPVTAVAVRRAYFLLPTRLYPQ